MTEPPGRQFTLEVHPTIPARLARLEELANNLAYSWDRDTRSLFARLHPALWDAVGHNPKALLRRVDEERLLEAAQSPSFLESLGQALATYDTYQEQRHRVGPARELQQEDLIAYFCAEFGFHESLPIYSGGLGILAGDVCKAASDAGIPLVAVGLLYRQGYFLQLIDREGNQRAEYHDSDYLDLPIAPVLRRDGEALCVPVELPGRSVAAKVWRARIGRVDLYLLDTDLAQNSEADRALCHRLYGGDRTTRICQEIILGVGGARALRAMEIKPTVWHVNEGHAAFLNLERTRELMREGLDAASAFEAVAASSVFTTHTAVPAGHDHFQEEMVAACAEPYCREVGIDVATVVGLGRMPDSADFNMTALAVRSARFHNGVSRIHRDVSARLLRELWPQVPAEENPIAHVTNGVHVPTFLAPELGEIFERYLGADWNHHLTDTAYWQQHIDDIPDHLLWSTHQHVKAQMLHLIRHRVSVQHLRNRGSEAHLDRLFRHADPQNPNVLTLGFSRRFATYKRATLLFENLDWLREIVSDAKRPVLFIFAGKAHPADTPGQALIRRVHEIAQLAPFEGKILLVEGYDLHLGRRMSAGADVWLNNPVYPLEACGTSGMKAGMNGVLNLSVLDGWWAEAYDGENGWAIKPASDHVDSGERDHQEARTLYELLQDKVVPLYYERDHSGCPRSWVKLAKRSIASILPRFNALRMMDEYVEKFYLPASSQGRRYAAEKFQFARIIAAWKGRVIDAWPGVALRRLDQPATRICRGDSIRVEVAVQANGLSTDDLRVELVLVARESEWYGTHAMRLQLAADERFLATGERRYTLDLAPEMCGKLKYCIRIYPHHAGLAHPFEMGLMKWLE